MPDELKPAAGGDGADGGGGGSPQGPPATQPPPSPAPPVPPAALSADEGRAAIASALFGALALVVGVIMLMVAAPSYDYIQGMGLRGYASAGSLAGQSAAISGVRGALGGWAQERIELYRKIVAEEAASGDRESQAYVKKSEARDFFRAHIARFALLPDVEGKKAIVFSALQLDFNNLDQAFARYCGATIRGAPNSLCVQSKNEADTNGVADGHLAGLAWQSMIDAQREKELGPKTVEGYRDALRSIREAEQEVAPLVLGVKDADSSRLVFEAYDQYNQSVWKWLFALPLIVQYVVMAFAFGVVGAYLRYAAEIFTPAATRLRRAGAVAINGGGAALLLVLLSLGGVQIVTLGAEAASATPNPMFITGVSLVAGVANDAILGAVRAIAGRLFPSP